MFMVFTPTAKLSKMLQAIMMSRIGFKVPTTDYYAVRCCPTPTGTG